MDIRHLNALRRIHQADRSLADDGEAPADFHLMPLGGMRFEVHHPRWGPSWAVPDKHTIDDLGEMGILRVRATSDEGRSFALTMQGRREAAAVAEQQMRPQPAGGRAPAAVDVLRWLMTVAAEEPACFDIPERLLDRAVTEGLIEFPGRESLAQRILGLVDQGYLRGDVPELALGTAQQRLARTVNLELAVLAEELAAPPTSAITIIGNVINSQVAAGDINSFVTFIDVLDRAHAEIDALEDIDPEAKEDAKGLIERLRAKAMTGAGEIITGAGGAIAAGVIARLLGLPHG